MSVKDGARQLLNRSKAGRTILQARRLVRNEDTSREILASTHEFVDRSKGSDRLCIVIAGYKPTLWDDVFDRLAAFVPDDVDVCILTSGLVSNELKDLAGAHGWSYLSTSFNHLSLVQNTAIELHPKAKWIYKIDEDMFLTEGFFETLADTYDRLVRDSPYLPAFVAPLTNISCYGHLRLLDKVGLTDDFRATGLTDMKYGDGIHHNKAVIEDPRVARYLWGETQPALRDIDALSERFAKDGFSYSICPVRYSIGAILFSRETWEDFGHFPTHYIHGPHGLGDDEEHICEYACLSGRVMAVSENILVGHLGYGGAQTKSMLEYYQEHPAQFALPRTSPR